MDRLFGKSKPAAPKPTLQDAHDSMEKRGEGIDQKIMKLDKELGCARACPSRSASWHNHDAARASIPVGAGPVALLHAPLPPGADATRNSSRR